MIRCWMRRHEHAYPRCSRPHTTTSRAAGRWYRSDVRIPRPTCCLRVASYGRHAIPVSTLLEQTNERLGLLTKLEQVRTEITKQRDEGAEVLHDSGAQPVAFGVQRASVGTHSPVQGS